MNGKVVRSGAKRFGAVSAKIIVESKEGIEEEIRHPPLLVAYHKPLNVLSTVGDNWNRPNLETLSDTYPILKSMHPVGRLDADTSGLLLFSSLGDLTQHLLNPNSLIPREYVAVVEGKVQMQELKATLAEGVETTSGTFTAQLLEAEILSEQREIKIQQRNLKKIEACDDGNNDGNNDGDGDGDGDGNEDGGGDVNGGDTDDDDDSNSSSIRARIRDGKTTIKLVDCSRIRLSVCEGKYRMVRRILHNAGHSVVTLHRVSYGEVKLDSSLTGSGEIRECSEQETSWARGLVASRQSKSNTKKYRRADNKK